MKAFNLKGEIRGTANAERARIFMLQIKTAAMTIMAFMTLCICSPSFTYAAEGASSHYLPGAGGDIFLALPPKPGFQFADVLWYQTGSTDTTVLKGRVSFGADLDIFLDLASLTYTFEKPVLGGRYTIGAVIPFGYADLEGSITGPFGGRIEFSDDSFDLSDIAIIPFQMNWSSGMWSFKLLESIVAPTGGYDTTGSELVNLGRNYWSFDSVGAVTWFNPGSGTEVSIAPGVMFNTENPDTNYETGTEFHMDFVANQFLSKGFALGLRGYYYNQLTGDSGSGAKLGDHKSESFAIGPGLVWIPSFGDGRFTVFGKWMHDISAENRFESDYITLTVSWKF